jgi:hypothetical protein
MTRLELSPKEFAENLELTGTVDERFPTRTGGWQPDTVSVPIAYASPMQRKCRLDSGGEIQEIPNTNI